MAVNVRLRGELLASFAALALSSPVLASMASYSYATTPAHSQLACGGPRGEKDKLFKLVVVWGSRLAVIGIAIGLASAWGNDLVV